MAEHNKLGDKGEAMAINYLLASGYDILETNYRFEKAEIDIVAKKDDLIVVVEVKTRASSFFGDPIEAVDAKKEGLLSDAIDAYLEDQNLDNPIRFDVIGIVMDAPAGEQLSHIQDAF